MKSAHTYRVLHTLHGRPSAGRRGRACATLLPVRGCRTWLESCTIEAYIKCRVFCLTNIRPKYWSFSYLQRHGAWLCKEFAKCAGWGSRWPTFGVQCRIVKLGFLHVLLIVDTDPSKRLVEKTNWLHGASAARCGYMGKAGIATVCKRDLFHHIHGSCNVSPAAWEAYRCALPCLAESCRRLFPRS